MPVQQSRFGGSPSMSPDSANGRSYLPDHLEGHVGPLFGEKTLITQIGWQLATSGWHAFFRSNAKPPISTSKPVEPRSPWLPDGCNNYHFPNPRGPWSHGFVFQKSRFGGSPSIFPDLGEPRGLLSEAKQSHARQPQSHAKRIYGSGEQT